MIRAALASTALFAGLAWSGALVVDPAGWNDGAVLLIGLGLLLSTTVSFAGMLLSGGRWARRTAFSALGGGLVIALVRPIDVWWVMAIGLTAVAFGALLSAQVGSLTRKLPSATGPPDRAVVLTMILIGAPFAVGVAAWEGANGAAIIVGLTAPLVGLWYSRVLPGGLYVARYAWPVAAVTLSFLQPWPGGAASAALGILVFLIGLDQNVKIAFYPPTETGSTYAIPPELTPPDILEAADVDERGHRR